MRKLRPSILALLLGLFCFIPAVGATTAIPENENIKDTGPTPNKFTWGVELGSSIDLSGYDTSTFDADIILGFRTRTIRTIGIGTGIHRAFGSDNTFVPIYAIINTSFRSAPAPCFFHCKIGYSFNTIGNSPTYGDVMASIGLGFNLAMRKKFQSHIIVGYGFRHIDSRHRELTPIHAKNINLAQIAFGLMF